MEEDEHSVAGAGNPVLEPSSDGQNSLDEGAVLGHDE
jgi:hypothetical protein